MTNNKRILLIRWLTGFFIFALIISGLTAIPVEYELSQITNFCKNNNIDNIITVWINKIYQSIKDINFRYPFFSYGYDWLAFAHIILGILFIGPFRNPEKNIWIIEFGMIACILIIPFALIMGQMRNIPFVWRLIDCSFGILGIIPLMIIRNQIKKLK